MNYKKAAVGMILIFLLLLMFTAACTGEPDTELAAMQGTVAAVSTQIAEQAGVNATQEAFIIYLATRPAMLITPVGPDTPPTPYWPVMGKVQIENGRCCVGGVAGEPLPIMLDLQAESPQSEVMEMRLAVGSRFLTEEEMESVPWYPFARQKNLSIPVPLNWSGRYE